VDTPGLARDVVVSGSHAYVADWDSGLQVVDITDPEDPQIIGEVDTPFYDLGGGAYGVDIAGSYALVANAYTGLLTIDITDPHVPQIVNTMDLNLSAEAVVVSNDLAYVTTGHGEWSILRSSIPGTLKVIDINDPVNPQVLGSVNMNCVGRDLVISGSHAYITGRGEGFQVIDITNPAEPLLVGGSLPSHGVIVTANSVYTSNSKGLLILPKQCTERDVREDGFPSSRASRDMPGIEARLFVHPNPFNPQTAVSFSLTRAGWADVSVYDLTGRQVTSLATRQFDAGPHTVTWTGRDSRGGVVPSGTYIVRLETEERVESRKVMLVR
jgi:hypothetical protein